MNTRWTSEPRIVAAQTMGLSMIDPGQMRVNPQGKAF